MMVGGEKKRQSHTPPLSPAAHAVQISFKSSWLFIQNVPVLYQRELGMLESELYVYRGCYMGLEAIGTDRRSKYEEPLQIFGLMN